MPKYANSPENMRTGNAPPVELWTTYSSQPLDRVRPWRFRLEGSSWIGSPGIGRASAEPANETPSLGSSHVMSAAYRGSRRSFSAASIIARVFGVAL
jgi:hypothetical protein